MLGSKYNPATHRRELVGVGYTTALTDVSSYTPFEINYSPLSEIDDTYSYVQADSLIVMLLSSANTDAQQGSALYLDNLQLWTGFPPTVAADPTFGDTTATACGSFNWFGDVLTASGDYSHLFENGNANGGDSTVTLHLTIKQPTYSEVTVATCGSYNWFGEELTASGDYSHLIENGNANGCDSTVTLHLTINQPTEGEVTVAECGSYNWFGEELTASGDYPHLLENGNAHGCDSTVTLHLTIYTPVTELVEATICESELPYTWNGIVFENDGTDSVMLTSSNDCDSLVIMTLTVTRINTGLTWIGTQWYAIIMEAAQENA